MAANNAKNAIGGPLAKRMAPGYAHSSDVSIQTREWNNIVEKLEGFESRYDFYTNLGRLDYEGLSSMAKPIKDYLNKHHPNHGAADLIDHYAASVVIKAQIGSPTAGIIGLSKEVFDWAATKAGNKFSGFSIDDLAADFAGFAGYSPTEAVAAGLLSHTDSNVDWTGVQGNWGSNIKKVMDLIDPSTSQTDAQHIDSSFAFKEMFGIPADEWRGELFDIDPTYEGISKGSMTGENGPLENARGTNPPSRGVGNYSFFGLGPITETFSGGMAAYNAAVEDAGTCKWSATYSNGAPKPLGKQGGMIYNGKVRTKVTPENLGWTDPLSITQFGYSAKYVLGGNESDLKYAGMVVKNDGSGIFNRYNATSYTIESDQYTVWYWVNTGVNLPCVISTGPQTLCDGTVLAGPVNLGGDPPVIRAAESKPYCPTKHEKWYDTYLVNSVIVGVGRDGVRVTLKNNTEEELPPPLPPIPEDGPPITATPTAYGDIIELTSRPKSRGGRRYKVLDSIDYVDCNGNSVPRSNFILTDHNCLKVLRPPPCEITINTTWVEPPPIGDDVGVSYPPEFDPSFLPPFLPSSLFPWRSYEEFIEVKKDMAGVNLGDDWFQSHQDAADEEWDNFLELFEGWDNLTPQNFPVYSPPSGDFIYDSPHVIHTTTNGAGQFGNHTNAAGEVEDWSGIPTNTNIPSTIRNVSSVTSGVVDGLYTYDKVSFEHKCPPCAVDLSQYPNNIWLKYEVFYNGVKI